MAEVAISKRLKISEAQQYMMLAVLGAAVILGVALSLGLHFVDQIAFNARVIGAKDEAIKTYSNVIEQVGVCVAPKGDVYTADELKKCNPNSIEVSEIPGTLRATILGDMAANKSLNAVVREGDTDCLNPSTDKTFTYEELNQLYNEADSEEELASASKLIKSCSALRVIPDALPAYRNEEALLSSLNKIFIMSGWEPESLSPSGSSSENGLDGLGSIALNLSVEANSEVTLRVLSNIERSIREFNVEQASIEWNGGGLTLQALATAYYVEESELTEVSETVDPKGEEL